MIRKKLAAQASRSPMLMVLLLMMILGMACSGQQGSAGPAGSPGPAGSAGEQGLQGPAGPSGPSGSQGPVGPAGAPGVSSQSGPAEVPTELVAAWGVSAAIAQYQDIEQAIADGYAEATPCLSDPQKGAQGYHYRNLALLDGVVGHTKPELLMYIPTESGEMRLVAAEYAVPNNVEPVPSLFGQTFHPPPSPSTAPLLVLHAWLWEPNPDGVFADWNPNLSCDPESVAAWEARASIARYADVQQAISDGYAQVTPCVGDPELGAQGIHYLNRELLIDGVVDHTKPEMLMYLPSGFGRLRLVAFEYAVPNDVEPVPSLFGHEFHPPPPPSTAPLLVLHAWMLETNPKGVFADWNPNLSCPSLGAAIDAMTHPMSQALTDRLSGGGVPFSGADELIALLDEANVQNAVMMSLGLIASAASDDAAVSAEDDFVAAEVAKYPDRLIGFCGINPLYAGALSEIDRCLGLKGMAGIKLGPPFSGMDLTDQDHVAALSAVFDKAREHGVPVQLHTQTPMDPPMDSNALANVAAIIADHPDVRVNYSHCAGVVDEHTSQLWLKTMRPNPDSAFLDISLCLREFEDAPLAKRELIVWRLQKWGVEHLLFSSDHITLLGFPTPGQALHTLGKYPFTQDEIELITSNDASAWLEGQ
ncbi:MAG: amidohydrolase family protein [Chloroflexi bacterium]|nr:amidohydrolase family protein [Chloroflexota bacterium]